MSDLGAMIGDFVATLRREDKSAHTIRNYESDLDQFLAYLTPPGGSAPPLEEIDLPVLRECIGALYKQKLAATSTRRKIAALRAMFQHALRAGAIKRNPAKLLLLPKMPKGLPKVPTAEQVNAIVDGIEGASNLGGVSSTIAQRQGTIGAVVHGGIRDVPHSRQIGFPVWSSAVTPMTGKYRLLTVEINGAVDIAGIRVAPGDIVYADDDGVCFLPRDKAAAILALCQKKKQAEDKRLEDIRRGVPVAALAGKR